MTIGISVLDGKSISASEQQRQNNGNPYLHRVRLISLDTMTMHLCFTIQNSKAAQQYNHRANPFFQVITPNKSTLLTEFYDTIHIYRYT